jgi:HNH endonuclease/AP2 domain
MTKNEYQIGEQENIKTCIATLKFGKRKGQLCGLKINKKSVSGNYCGKHLSEENPKEKIVHPVIQKKKQEDELIQVQRPEGEEPRKLNFITASLVLFSVVMFKRKKQNGNKKKDPLLVNNLKIDGYEYLFISPIVKLNGSPWVWNSKTKNWLNARKRKSGYWRLDVNVNLPKRKSKNFCVNRMIAFTFVSNSDPEHNTVVHHKNNKRWDNRLENLEWVTPKRNAEERIQPETYRGRSSEETTQFEGFPIPLSFMKKETYVNPPENDKNTVFLISKDGRVRNSKTKWFQNPKPNPDGYVVLHLRIEKKSYFPILSDLLAMMFKKNPDKKKYTVVDHIDRNPLNNDLSNIEWSTISDNNRNRNKLDNRTSKGYGVCFSNKEDRWVSYLTEKDGNRRRIGSYTTEELALRSYDQEEYKLFGNKNLNYPTEIEDTMKMVIPKAEKRYNKYKGLNKTNNGKWTSQITVNKVRYSVGTFDTEEEAAKEYDKKAIELLGLEKAKKRKLNFPV